MIFDYSALNGKIIEVFGTQYEFSKQMDISERSISLKLNNKVSWKSTEISKACKLLQIRVEDIGKYFFKYKVQMN